MTHFAIQNFKKGPSNKNVQSINARDITIDEGGPLYFDDPRHDASFDNSSAYGFNGLIMQSDEFVRPSILSHRMNSIRRQGRSRGSPSNREDSISELVVEYQDRVEANASRLPMYINARNQRINRSSFSQYR